MATATARHLCVLNALELALRHTLLNGTLLNGPARPKVTRFDSIRPNPTRQPGSPNRLSNPALQTDSPKGEPECWPDFPRLRDFPSTWFPWSPTSDDCLPVITQVTKPYRVTCTR